MVDCFGNKAHKKHETLFMIIRLQNTPHDPHHVPLTPIMDKTTILDRNYPIQIINAHQRRNLALLVETSVKNVILAQLGKTAAQHFMIEQQHDIEAQSS